MRTQEEWINRTRYQALKQLSPRLQEIYLKAKEPDFPMEIKSSFIYGPSNYGKTVYVIQLLMEEKRQLYLKGDVSGKKSIFISVPDLLAEIKNSFNSEGNKTEFEIVKYYSEVHLLILDDFGTVKVTDWVLQTLYLIINHRYEYLRKTIFTSNKTLPEISEIYGDTRITSRIDRMCEGQMIEKLNWRDTND